jgi:hypothetical protein
MAFQSRSQRARLCIVDVNVRVVTSCQNLVGVKLEASDYVAIMSAKGNVFRFHIGFHPAFMNRMVALVEGLEQMKTPEGR